ncbi:MAG: carbamoyltransferase HypF [Bacillota bacterium]|nr:carbamoyltransferase HypF [Bacillota bacterium]
MIKTRYFIKITGIVQGIGFRPFVYNLARDLSINGWVSNTGEGVIIEAESSRDILDQFVKRLKSQAPSLSKIKDISVQEMEYLGYSDFTIKESISGRKKDIYISPDVSICPDCIRELYDAADRRYQYPFINCTNCGPRFTIVRDIPYDRINTTMNKFPMCSECAKEYKEPSDRRYHAQPVSCHNCGPELSLLDSCGKKVETNDIISLTRKLISSGKIIAIKGLGGYHLACDAWNTSAVKELRKRKIRDDKPFALMARDIGTAQKYCHINKEERRLLESYRKPIVLLKKQDDVNLPYEIAPGNPCLGIMLPYTPVHLLMFNYKPMKNENDVAGFTDLLVMTSANRSSEPIYYKEDEALENLSEIADYFLTNNRDIYIRTDDSVARVFGNKEYIIRRSRGYVPVPVTVDNYTEKTGVPSVLACGGELKNTFCINKGNEFYLSHHIGDLENTETLDSFIEGIEHFKRIFDTNCSIIAYDMHPEYLSTKFAKSLDIPVKVPIQHHHAHIASCMAENGLTGDVIGIAFDGTGYGEDGNIWGGEFFYGDFCNFKRAGHLKYVKMPGGEAAIKEPWRMALSYICDYFENPVLVIDQLDLFKSVEKSKIDTIIKMLEKNINSPSTSSAGRLFDAVSALLGIRESINYEGQAAIELEYKADGKCTDKYDFDILDFGGSFEISAEKIFKEIVEDLKANKDKSIVSKKFHNTAAEIIAQGCLKIRSITGLNRVTLSGGVFQNITLLEEAVKLLENREFEVYTHSQVPTNDGGISLGQAVMALARSIPKC